ncbi:MAG TPA: hypothetical protein VFW31_08800 [Candidatus Angelobacter sp.]|nr:hypothetical protein [Candidatus Angelobacter sp.]
MIPLFAVVRVRNRRRQNIRLWLPLFLVWLMLLPLVLLLLPFAVLACLLIHMDPWRSISGSWQVFAGLRGTHIELANAEHHVLVHIF